MNTETTWIKMSERKPTAADFADGTRAIETLANNGARYTYYAFFPHYDWIYWRKINLVPPPPRELTQREKDEAAADAYLNKTAFNGGIGYLITKAHIAGKYDERREILAALDALWIEAYGCRFIGESAPRHPGWIKFRARLEEQGAAK